MGAGFLALLFNPYAWVVMAAMAVASFSGGVVKGWNWSNADHWRAQAAALELAGKQKDEMLRDDVARAEAADAELARMEANLEIVIHEANKAPGICKLSEHELGSLRKLTASGAKRR